MSEAGQNVYQSVRLGKPEHNEAIRIALTRFCKKLCQEKAGDPIQPKMAEQRSLIQTEPGPIKAQVQSF